MSRKLYVACTSYRLARAFATVNHIHHDDVVVMGQPEDVRAANLTGVTVYVVGDVDEELDLAVRVAFGRSAGCSVRRVEPLDEVDLT